LLISGAFTAITASAAHTWSQQAKLQPRDIAPFDHIGFAISVSHDGQTALLGAASHNDFRGAAYVFVHHDSGWVQQAKLTADDLTTVNFRVDFGWAVALSDDGNTAVIGAPDKNLGAGAVYVFTRSGVKWTRVAEFTDKERAPSAEFGQAVTVSHDGKTIVVGAPAQNQEAGATYIFVRGASTWVQKAKLTVSSVPAFIGFGHSVAMGRDGTDVLVGAPLQDGFTGAAYVFTRSGSQWYRTATLTGGFADAEFGESVDISHDGDVALIGAPQSNVFQGIAYVFSLTAAGWGETAELSAPDSTIGDFFGFSVALGHDAETALIGAPDHQQYRGAAYVFSLSLAAWTQTALITAGDATPGDYFGFSVALARDHFVALIGADNADRDATTFDSGAAYVFTRA